MLAFMDCAAHQVCFLFTSPTSLSRKYLPTYLPIIRFYGAVRSSGPLRICRRSHLPTHTPPCDVRFSLLSVVHAHLCLSLLVPAIPPTARPPAPLALVPLSAPPASASARGAIACFRSAPGRAKGTCECGPWWCAHAPRLESTGPDLPSHML